MQNKIKLFLIFLAIAAVVSVLSFFDIVGGVKSAMLGDSVKPLPPVEDDVDNDGLSNSEESYWETDIQNPDTDGDGFLDGEEVVSGKDPVIKAPNDTLLSLNMTQRMTDLAIAGLAEGSLKPGNPNYDQSLDDLALHIIDKAVSDLTPIADIPKLTVVESSKKNQIIYVKEVRDTFQQLVKIIADQANSLKSSSQPLFASDDTSEPDEDFVKTYEELKNIHSRVVAISTPENWEQYHIALIEKLDQLLKVNKTIAYRYEDPVKTAVAYNLWPTAYGNIYQLVQDFSDMIVKEGLINDLDE